MRRAWLTCVCACACVQMTARSKIAQIVSDTTNEAVTAIAALRETLLHDETVKTVASLEPVALDVSKVVDVAIKESGGDEAAARARIAQIVSDTTNKAVFSATAALREKLLHDETVQTVSLLEPVPLDVTKVVDAAIKESGGDEARARRGSNAPAPVACWCVRTRGWAVGEPADGLVRGRVRG